MDVPALADQQRVTYITSVRTRDVLWKTCQEQSMLGIDGDRDDDIYRSIYL